MNRNFENQQLLKGKIQEAVAVSVGATSFAFGKSEIPLSLIIGFQHVSENYQFKPKGFSLCGATPRSLELAAKAISTDPTGIWAVFYYDLEKKASGNPKLSVLLFKTEKAISSELVPAFHSALGYEDKKILFIANPFGGTNKAMATFENIVIPMMKLASQAYDIILTKAVGHATEMGQQLDLQKYKSCATISGDGVFHELLNGLLTRPDWKVASQLPIGCIGAGSSNAINKNFDLPSHSAATLAVLKGKTRKMDVMAIMQNETVMFSHLAIYWAFIVI